jgi:hypothetical protein
MQVRGMAGLLKISKIITTDLHCWLNGQASVGFLPLAENKLSDFGFDQVIPVPEAHREPPLIFI